MRRVLPQTLQNEACATKDSIRWILVPRVSKPGDTVVGASAARPAESKHATTIHAGHRSERFAPSRPQVT
ncbi:MAG: hypothetical protein ACRECZ_09060, partial [Methylocella sp.]